MSNQNQIQAKREKVDQLRQEIRARKSSESAAVADATDAVREQRLDREIEALQAELAAMGAGPAGLESMTIEQLREQPEYSSIEGRSSMDKNQLVKAIKAARAAGPVELPPEDNRTNIITAEPADNQEGDKR